MIDQKEAERCKFGNYPVTFVPHFTQKMSDGVSLAMSFTFPGTKEDLAKTPFKDCEAIELYKPTAPVPFEPAAVILEYIPYRKDDYCLSRDLTRYPYFSSHGFVFVHLDLRGTGSSEGLYYDEYEYQEQKDAMEFIGWIASLDCTNGNVGMYGKSWGAFNGMQVGFYQPPALKAAVAAYFTDDRFNRDFHHVGGCMIASEMIYWATRMHTWNASPPNPKYTGKKWKEMWRERLEKTSYPWLNYWIKHQHKDDYWKHGSVSEDYNRVQCAVLAIGGWRDNYRNSVFTAVQNLPNCRGIIGPFSHNWPDCDTPGPAIDFLGECKKWFDFHLRGIENGAMDEPLLRMYLQEEMLPSPKLTHRAGRWITEKQWPPKNPSRLQEVILDNTNQELILKKGETSTVQLKTKQAVVSFKATQGAWCGEWLSYLGKEDLPGNQQFEDVQSLTWTTKPFEKPLAVIGNPSLDVTVAVENSDTGLIVARLCDIFPDGQSTLMSLGVLNLTHREGNEKDQVKPLVKGKSYKVRVKFDAVSYTLKPGHQLKLSVTPNYWPYIWPSKDSTMLTVTTGLEKSEYKSQLTLPIFHLDELNEPDKLCHFDLPNVPSWFAVKDLRPLCMDRSSEFGLSTGIHKLTVKDDMGLAVIPISDTTVGWYSEKTAEIKDGDPLSAKITTANSMTFDFEGHAQGDGEMIKTEVKTSATVYADKENFYTDAKLECFLGDEVFFAKTWKETIKRELM